MQTVSQLNQNHPDIADHREEHLADALCLAFFARSEVELAQLSYAIDAARDVFSEILADFVQSSGGVLDHVMQQASLEARHLHMHVC